MKNVLSLFKSRKAWLTLMAIAATLFGGSLGLTNTQQSLVAGLFAVLVFSIMGEDVAKYIKIELPDEKKEKKEE